MTARRALALVSGQPAELPAGDRLSGLPIVLYVSNDGDDGDDGLSEDTAKATLAAAAALMLPGDTLRLERGSTFRETCSTPAGSFVESYGRGPRPIISGQDAVTSFTIHSSGPAYTFAITLPAAAAGYGYPGVWEDGLRMSEVKVGDAGISDSADAIAAVEATPGTFYFDGPGTQAAGWSAGSKTYYIHASDGGNPNSNGSAYEAYAREYAVDDDCHLTGIRIQSGFQHDGSSPNLTDCTVQRLARHGGLPAVPQIEGVVSIGPNPAYTGGGFFHSNPASAVGDCVYRRCKAVGDESLSPYTGYAFYSHGTVSTDLFRDRATLVDCEAYNVHHVLDLGAVIEVEAIGLRARNFEYFCSVTYGQTLTLRDCDIRGGTGGGSGADGSRQFQMDSTSKLFIHSSKLDLRSEWGFFKAGQLGEIVMEDSTFVFRPRYLAATTPAFVWTNSTQLKRFEIRRSRIIVPDAQGFQELINALSVTTLAFDDVLLVNHKDSHGVPFDSATGGKCTINGSGTTLAALDADARVINIDGDKCILSDGDDGVKLAVGTYEPGDWIFSDVASPGGFSNQPRNFVLVGDVIVTSGNGTSDVFFRLEYTPTEFLNGVCYNSGGDGTCYIAVGNNGLILQSDTEGQNWSVVGNGVTSEDLHAVWAEPTAGAVVAVGDAGTVLYSADGGATWAEATDSDTTANLRGVATDDGTNWIAAGSGGAVIKSTDGGDNWTASAEGSNDYHAVHRDHYNSLFLIGGNAGELRTSSDGGTWTSRTSKTKNRIVAFASGESWIIGACKQTTRHTDTFIESGNGTDWTNSEQTVPFEVRGLTGSTNANTGYGGAFDGQAFAAVGESQAIAQTDRHRWSVARIVDDGVTDRGETMAKHLAAAV